MIAPPDPMLSMAMEQSKAAWIQAYAAIAQGVLTLVALGIAIAVPWWQRRIESRQRSRQDFLQGRDIAISISSAVVSWRDQVVHVAQMARGARAADVLASFGDVCTVPDSLQAKVGQLRLLGDVALPLQAAIYVAGLLREMTAPYRRAASGEGGDAIDREALRKIHRQIFRLKAFLVVSEKALRALFLKTNHPAVPNELEDVWYEKEVLEIVRNDINAYDAVINKEVSLSSSARTS